MKTFVGMVLNTKTLYTIILYNIILNHNMENLIQNLNLKCKANEGAPIVINILTLDVYTLELVEQFKYLLEECDGNLFSDYTFVPIHGDTSVPETLPNRKSVINVYPTYVSKQTSNTIKKIKLTFHEIIYSQYFASLYPDRFSMNYHSIIELYSINFVRVIQCYRRYDTDLYEFYKDDTDEYFDRFDTIFQTVFKSMNIIHELGFISNDLKPENILILKNKEKLQIVLHDFEFITPIGEITKVRGTFGYINPTKFLHFNKTHESSILDDYYSFCMMYLENMYQLTDITNITVQKYRAKMRDLHDFVVRKNKGHKSNNVLDEYVFQLVKHSLRNVINPSKYNDCSEYIDLIKMYNKNQCII